MARPPPQAMRSPERNTRQLARDHDIDGHIPGTRKHEHSFTTAIAWKFSRTSPLPAGIPFAFLSQACVDALQKVCS